MNSIHLIGSEEVGRAADRMREAAETMRQAAHQITFALEMQQRYLDDWLQRFTELVETKDSP